MTDAGHAPLSIAELRKRLKSGDLSSVAECVSRILAIQNAPGAFWLPAMGDFIIEARAHGDVPDASWDRFVRASFQLKMPVVITTAYPKKLELVVARGSSQPNWTLHIDNITWNIVGHPAVQKFHNPAVSGVAFTVPGPLKVFMWLPNVWAAELAGRRTLLSVNAQCTLNPLSTLTNGTSLLVWSGLLHAQDVCEIPMPASELTVSEGAAEWFKSIKLYPNDETTSSKIIIENERPVFIFSAGAVPANLAMLIVLIDTEGFRWPVAELYAPRGELTSQLIYGDPYTGPAWRTFKGPTATVRFEFSPYCAHVPRFPGPYLSGAIEFPGIPIQVRNDADHRSDP